MTTSKSGHHKSPGPMHSKALASKKPFARKWADEVVAERGKKTGFHSLPNRKSIRKR
jgi:hypothetical protein